MEKEIYNARITSTKLGLCDRDWFTLSIYIEWVTDYGTKQCCAFGGNSMGSVETDWNDEKDTEIRTYNNFKFTSELLMRILDVVGVSDWEDLKGKLIRIKLNGKTGCACGIEAIGNILENKWFNMIEFYNSKGIY